jgi:hypothetical protein
MDKIIIGPTILASSSLTGFAKWVIKAVALNMA